MDIFHILLSSEGTKAIVVYVLLIILIITVLKYVLFLNFTESQGVQKLVGGMSVFIVAIISNEPWVFGVSLFIGGLIIASEEFMRSLVALLRSKDDKIPETLGALIKRATPEEVNLKREEEVAEIAKPEISQVQRIRPIPQAIIANLDKVKKVEEMVLDFYTSLLSTKIERQVRIEKGGLSFIADAIIRKEKDIQAIIEIKYMNKVDYLEGLLRHSLYRIRSVLPEALIIVSIVIENGTKTDAEMAIEKLKKYKNIQINIFKLEGEDVVKPLIISHGWNVLIGLKKSSDGLETDFTPDP